MNKYMELEKKNQLVHFGAVPIALFSKNSNKKINKIQIFSHNKNIKI